MTAFQLLKILTGFIGSFAFAITFNVRGKHLALASLGGFLACVGYELFTFVFDSEFLRCFVVSVIITLYSELLARIVKTPTTTFIMTSLLPLVPGGALYYTMSHAFRQDWYNFYENGMLTLQFASAIALGIIVTTSVFQLVVNSVSHFKNIKNSKIEKKMCFIQFILYKTHINDFLCKILFKYC